MIEILYILKSNFWTSSFGCVRTFITTCVHVETASGILRFPQYILHILLMAPVKVFHRYSRITSPSTATTKMPVATMEMVTLVMVTMGMVLMGLVIPATVTQ